MAFTTLTIFAPLAQASHPQPAVRAEGTAKPFELVATPIRPRGVAFARHVLPVRADRAAVSRVIYANRDRAPSAADDAPSRPDSALLDSAGCSAPGSSAGIAMALAMLALRRRRR